MIAKHRWYITIFSTSFMSGMSPYFHISTVFRYVTPVTSLLRYNDPGGDLIRVDLIRFPGSIPGAI